MNIDKVVEYHNKKIKNFNLYRQITANKNYVFPESNNQFNIIAKKSNTLQMFRLVNRIFKRFKNKSNKKKSIHYIINLLYQDKTDVEKYQELEKHIRKYKRQNDIHNDRFHSDRIYDQLNDSVKKFKVKKLLDIGCGTGHKTVFLASLFNAEPHGVDVKSWDTGMEQNRSKDLHFSYFNGEKTKYKNNTFDLVVINMVMHHTQKKDEMIKEAYRVLKKGGILYVRDHDALREGDKILIDIEHILWRMQTNDNSTLNKWIQEKIYYLDRFILDYLANVNKFKLVHADYYSVNPVYNEINEQRAFYAIYKK